MIIDRALFYQTLTSIDSPNLSYVEEINGFKKSKAPVNLFEVIKRLDAFDLFHLMKATGDEEMAAFIRSEWLIQCGDTLVAVTDGFDCWVPEEVRRDRLIKLYNRTRDLNQVKELVDSTDYSTYFYDKVFIGDPYDTSPQPYWVDLADDIHRSKYPEKSG